MADHHTHSHSEKTNHSHRHSHSHEEKRDNHSIHFEEECAPNSTLDKYIDIAHIPLLLAYPTSLLASSLIFQEGQLHLVSGNNVKGINEFMLSVGFIPAFLASLLTIIYTYMGNGPQPTGSMAGKSLEGNIKNNKVLLGLLGLILANNILGSVRTVVLSIVLIMNVNFPFITLSLLFDIFTSFQRAKLNFFPTSLDESQLYFIIFAYFVLYQIKDSLRDFNQLNQKNDIIVPLGLFTIGGIGILYNHSIVQPSMILVTLGCGIILNVTKLDLNVVHFKQGSPTVTGIISILLCFLSFGGEDYMSNKLLFAGEVVLILCTALIPVDPSLFKSSTSSSKSSASSKTPSESDLTILSQLLLHKDTRAIFSFLLLNTSFMFVQFLYSFRSKSLGLLSDSLHMALDCTSLALGLVAGVLAKRPPTETYPFGLARIETLAGFANGVLLIGIVAGIVIEGIERIINPVSLEKTGELLIVSFLGLVVNIVGIFAFNHGHEHGGHSHGHSHSHSHVGGDDDVHDNENMKGIFLHILADTLGSAGVVLSTLLTSWFHSNIFDPLASLFIAIMIFFSAVPLIKSSASNLLLSLDDKKDEMMRDILSQVSTTPGVVSYTTPRFWPSVDVATNSSPSDHGHSHSIEIDHHHDHSHTCEHSHEHSNGHAYGHFEPESQIKFKLIGYIHVQYIEGENSTIIKKRVQKVFENNGIRAWIQVENESSNCWCRANK